MPPLSSLMNIRNLDNAPANQWGFESGSQRDLSNEASYETSDSDNFRRPDSDDKHDADRPVPIDEVPEDSSEVTIKAEPLDAEADATSADAPRRFVCKVCNQAFTRKHNMVSHELTHLAAKPHQCPLCELLFRRIHDLRRHEKLHTGEKPYHCLRCQRRFARPDALTRHLHSPHACVAGDESVDSIGPEDEAMAEPEVDQSAEPMELERQLLGLVLTTDMSNRPESSSGSTSDVTAGGKDAFVTDVPKESPKAAPMEVVIEPASASASCGSSGGSDNGALVGLPLNRSNYDMFRMKALQQQQQLAAPGKVRGFSREQHFHHHFHHYHHNGEDREQQSGNAWSLSDRELRADGKFSKHDDVYPRDIRQPRQDPQKPLHYHHHHHHDQQPGQGVPPFHYQQNAQLQQPHPGQYQGQFQGQYNGQFQGQYPGQYQGQYQGQQPYMGQVQYQGQQPRPGQAPQAHSGDGSSGQLSASSQGFQHQRSPPVHLALMHTHNPNHGQFQDHSLGQESGTSPAPAGFQLGKPYFRESNPYPTRPVLPLRDQYQQGWVLHGSSKRTAVDGENRPPMSYVSMELYQDLVTHTTTLQDSLSRMESRLKFLEKEAGDRRLDELG